MTWTLTVLCALGAEPVSIPAGSFTQGAEVQPDALPRQVQLEAFRIDRTEVSVQDFEAWVEAGGYTQGEVWGEAGAAWLAQNPQGAGREARAAGRSGDHPVVAVTWYEARAYCQAQGGRLPTEAEWERAACGGQERRWPWGDEQRVAAVWYDHGKTGHIDSVLTHAASEQDPSLHSPEGLLHMAGNVWEWTEDGYAAWPEGPVSSPTGSSDGPWKVLRGGSFMNLPSYCACAHREPARPERVAFTTGFRCAY